MKLSSRDVGTCLLRIAKSLSLFLDADIENGLEGTGKGKGKLGRSERVAWTYIHYQT